MKTKILLILIFSVALFFGCKKESNLKNDSTPNAKVLYKGPDCGNTFLIRFNENANNVPQNVTDSIFYGINLPSQYQIENLDINIDFRLPTNDEILSCTSQGIAYPQIFITNVNN